MDLTDQIDDDLKKAMDLCIDRGLTKDQTIKLIDEAAKLGEYKKESLYDTVKSIFDAMAKEHVTVHERLDGMTFEEYRLLRGIQNKALKKYKKGQMIFVAKNKNLSDKGVSLKKDK